jgi:hypothetical protein
MSEPVQIWFRKKIANLRAEADALERSLELYEQDHKKEAAPPAPAQTPRVIKPPPPRKTTVRLVRPDGTKVGKILDWLRGSGPSGRTLSEIHQFCVDNGIKAIRSHTRSMVWYAVQRGQVEKRGERYVAIPASTEANGLQSPESEPKEGASLN